MASDLVTELTSAITVPVVNAQGQSVGSETIDPKEFGGKINKQLLHDVVLMYRANQRAGTKRTNKRRGGGTAKGPKPRDYSFQMPKQAVRSATRMAILSKLADGEAVVVESFGLDKSPKTKTIHNVLKAIPAGTKTTKKGDVAVEKKLSHADVTILIGTAANDPVVYRSARNIEGVEILPAAEFNAYAVLKQKRLVLTRDALDVLRKKGK